ncbi:FAD-dependent oxidoreductase [Arachidicoccus sp.]|uniref:FAD-dependent oxidoreductase n=1 Tax=Arachidicoccus sp. TaxID=1872624 RepID=UPI003D1E0B50
MLLKNMTIAIVGGGPGGLTLARLLQLKGANVKVYERDFNQDARLIGSPLDLHDESGLAALRQANLLEAFKKNYRPGADKLIISNEAADILFSDHETKPEEDFGNEHFRPEIDRGPFRNMLLESLQPKTVIWDSYFISMEKEKQGWLLHFKNGNNAYADVVIAADGANSKVRAYITDIKPFYSGITMLEGTVHDAAKSAPQTLALLSGGKIMAFGNKKNILMGQKANNEIGFYASFKSEENWAVDSGLDFSNNKEISSWFKKEYAEWSDIWLELFENSATPFIPRSIYCMPLAQDWKALPNVTMLGDAAHVMPPFAGEGVNMAMLDALELSESLTSDKFNTLQEAISFYEINMRKRAAIAAQESLENGERMHSKDALNTMLGFFNQH